MGYLSVLHDPREWGGGGPLPPPPAIPMVALEPQARPNYVGQISDISTVDQIPTICLYIFQEQAA